MMMSRSRSAPFLFPSSDELEVAESLLLLSKPLSDMDDAKQCQLICRSSSLDSLSFEEESPVHSSISDSHSSQPIGSQIQSDPLLILSIAASLYQIDTMGMQTAAKNLIRQGQTQFTEPRSKPTSSDDVSSECSAASSITTTASDTSIKAALYSSFLVRPAAPEKEKMRCPSRGVPLRLWRRGQEIVEFLIASTSSGKPVTEAEIRKELGNGPDTSKALRLLVKHAEVKRFGAGGKKNPYLYMPKRQ